MTFAVFLGVLIVTLAVGIPISFGLGIAVLLLLVIVDVPLAVITEQAIRGVNSFPLLAIPMFLLIGELMSKGGIARRLILFAQSVIGFLTGGLGQVNVAASMFFGGITGSAVADTSAVGGIMIPSMKQQNYTSEHATAVTVSSSVIGILVPPSIPMILYGITTTTSISQLFIAGLIPGLIVGLALMLTTYWTARRSHAGRTEPFRLGNIVSAAREAWLGLVLPLILVGGILGGIFTATEAAIVGAIYSLVIVVFVYRELRVRDLWPIFVNIARLSGMVLFILAIATVGASLLTIARVPQDLVEAVSALTTNRFAVLALLGAVLLLVGFVIDLPPAIVILAPIMTPLAVGVGMEPVYFGIFMTFVLGIGLVTPPVGTVLYVGAAVGKVQVEKLVRSLLPFYATLLAVGLLLVFFPSLVTWLPEQLK